MRHYKVYRAEKSDEDSERNYDGGSDLHVPLLVARPSAEQLLFDVKCIATDTSCGQLYCIGWFLGRSTPLRAITMKVCRLRSSWVLLTLVSH